MTTLVLLAIAVALVSYSNGANDNFKGVATLYGSGSLGYGQALLLATGATLAGSILALYLAKGLLAAFSGKGLVPDAVARDPRFLTSVALAAGLTVLAATRLGLPISTTHALTGALVGAGFVAAGSAVNLGQLGSIFVAPLLASPLLAAGLAAAQYLLFRFGRRALGIERETCVCIGEELVPLGLPGAAAVAVRAPSITIDSTENCVVRYSGAVLGVQVGTLVERCHWLSAAAVSFARGLNDTPKIAALMLAATILAPPASFAFVAAAIAVGGLLGARSVAETMSRRITEMNPGQGFAANLATAVLVLFASRLGLPVSTTHVSCGALFGIGAVSGQARWRAIGQIGAAWVTTLPLAALLGAAAALALR